MQPSRGTIVVLLGVALFVSMMAVGAATAPSRDVAGAGAATPTASPVGTAAPPDGTPTDGDATATRTPLPDSPQTLVGVQGSWTTDGHVFLQDGDAVGWRESSADGYFEVSMLDDGRVLAAFANEDADDCGEYASPCARTGYRIIEPGPEPEIVDEYSFPVGGITNSEVHAADAVGDDAFVFVDMDEERIALVENGSETWEWRAESFYDAPDDPTTRDWLHMNDVDAIDEDRFLVSVRNANQILIVERGEGVVEVINEDRDDGDDDSCTIDGQLADFDDDGDVRCGDPEVIDHQHNPQWLGDGAVLVADSDNDRVVELHRDANGTWEPAWVLREAGGLELDWPRDADRLPNGNTLVTDSRNKRVVEVSPDGDLVWSIGTEDRVSGPGIPYEADRLPFGERTGEYDGPAGGDSPATTATPAGTAADTRTPLPQNTDGSDLGETGTEVPGLTLAVAGLQGTFAWVPFWFGEFHLAVTILALLAVIAGGLDHWRNREKRISLPF